MIYIFNEDYSQMLEIDDEQFAHLVDAFASTDKGYSLDDDLFNVLSIGMKQAPKVIIGEDSEGNFITFEKDERILN